jgi:hypothetical protein
VYKKQEKTSGFKREHPALQKMKFINCFQFFWVTIALLDSEPGTPLNPDPVRIRIHNTGKNGIFSKLSSVE